MVSLEGRSCKHCKMKLVQGINTKPYLVERKDYICYPCVLKRKKKAKVYISNKKTELIKVHNRSDLERRLVRKYNHVRVSALRRQILFSIEREKFVIITKQNCYYCDSYSTIINPNGLDRVDNSLGYIESNVVSCCKQCNFGKNEFSHDEYLSHCEKVLNHTISKRKVG